LPEIDIDDLLNIVGPSDPKKSLDVSVEAKEKYYARSTKRGDGLFELKDIIYHRTLKGIKGREYFCVWADQTPSTWEKESVIKCE